LRERWEMGQERKKTNWRLNCWFFIEAISLE
jgi:hypothetical protein